MYGFIHNIILLTLLGPSKYFRLSIIFLQGRIFEYDFGLCYFSIISTFTPFNDQFTSWTKLHCARSGLYSKYSNYGTGDLEHNLRMFCCKFQTSTNLVSSLRLSAGAYSGQIQYSKKMHSKFIHVCIACTLGFSSTLVIG